MRRVRWLLIPSLVALGGCYRYVPVDPAELQPGIRVRTQLSEAGMERFRELSGPGPGRIDGRLVRWAPDGLALEISAERRLAGFAPTTYFETLELAPELVVAVERRELHRVRTAGLVAAIVTGAVAAVVASGAYGGEETDPEGSGEEPRVAVWPLIRIFP